MSAYVYVVECEGYYKVGMTANLDSRVYSLSISGPFDVILRNHWKVCSTAAARKMEAQVHRNLKSEGFHHKGEWFCGCSVHLIYAHCREAASEFNSPAEVRKEGIRGRLRSAKKGSKLRAISKAEKEAKRRLRGCAHLTKYEFVERFIPAFRRGVVCAATGIDSKALYRFTYRGVPLSDSDIAKCYEWLISREEAKS